MHTCCNDKTNERLHLNQHNSSKCDPSSQGKVHKIRLLQRGRKVTLAAVERDRGLRRVERYSLRMAPKRRLRQVTRLRRRNTSLAKSEGSQSMFEKESENPQETTLASRPQGPGPASTFLSLSNDRF